MSQDTFDLKTQLTTLRHQADELGNMLILHGDQLENQLLLAHQDLLDQIRKYHHKKNAVIEGMLKLAGGYGGLQLQELSSANYAHLDIILDEIDRRHAMFKSLEVEMLPRIHKLAREPRQPILQKYYQIVESIKSHSLWETPLVIKVLQDETHEIWLDIKHAETKQKLLEQELEAVARDQLAHVNFDEDEKTLNVLADMNAPVAKTELASVNVIEAVPVNLESDLVFDDTFEIGKNMTLLKGRDIFPISKSLQTTTRKPVPQSPVSREEIPAPKMEFTSGSIHTQVPGTTVPDSSVLDASEEIKPKEPLSLKNLQSISSESRNIPLEIPAPQPPVKSPLSKLRIDHGKAMLLAEMVLQSHGTIRESRLVALIWELVRQRRFGLASVLAERCTLENEVPPVWLLRVLALSSSLYFPQGEVSRMIEKELAKYKSSSWSLSNQEEQQALGYLLRGAVLRLCLINPGKQSSSIMKSFPIRDGEVQLYNFCGRLVYNTGSSTRLASLLLKAPQNSPVVAITMKSTQEEISEWIREIRYEIFKFRETPVIYTTSNWSLRRSINQQDKGALWSYISSCFFLNQVYKMLIQIRNEERGASSRVRQDLNRIKEGLNHPQQIGLKIPRDINLIEVLPKKINLLVQQGLTIADRWLVADSPVKTTQQVSVQEVGMLKDEVYKRFSAVMQELSQLRFESQSENRVISLECLMEALQDIRLLVDQQYELPVREINPHHVINQELLRTSLSAFDENWQTNVTPQEKEQAVLEMLINPDLSWNAAMRRIAGRGAWPILNELRNIPNMLTYNEQQELENYLKYVDDPAYRDVMMHLANLQQELKQAEALKLITPDEFQACHWRITQISQENPAYWQLIVLKNEIELLKKFLSKKREEEQERIQTRFAQLNQRISLPFSFDATKAASDVPFDPANPPQQNKSEGGDWILDLD